ncbi:MAG: hypothetical protein GVY29_06905 [Spirochaetes bacterium]|nr:hypothetical protein [Spirochaetota bacterium]
MEPQKRRLVVDPVLLHQRLCHAVGEEPVRITVTVDVVHLRDYEGWRDMDEASRIEPTDSAELRTNRLEQSEPLILA